MGDKKNRDVELNLNDILPNRFQPRIKFNEESIIELSESIKEVGVLQPIIVRPIGDKYEIVAGERRYKAALLAGLETIPSIIYALDDKSSAEVALIENVQRRDLSPIEEAISYKKILDMGYITQEQLAAKLGRSQSTIANKIRLLNLCDEVQEALMEEKISERHARSLLKLDNFDDQRSLLKRIIKERLTVRRTDDEISKILLGTGIEPEEDAEPVVEEKEIAQETINPGFVDVDKIKETAEDLDIDDTIIDISSLFEDDELEEAHVEEPVSLKKNDIIDTSLFSKFLSPESLSKKEEKNKKTGKKTQDKKDDNVSEVDVKDETESSTSKIDDTKEENVDGEKIEEVGENNNMMNSEYNDIYNQKVGNPNDIVPVESFGKFFDPSYFDDEEVEKAPETPVLNLSNDGPAPSTIFNTDINPVKPDLMAVQQTDGLLSGTTSTTETPSGQPDLLASQPLNNPAETPAPTNAVPQSTEQSTMFPNLMNADSNANKEFIDEKTFNQMLDPTFVDGQQQTAPSNSDIIDISVFSKFLDPDYDVNSDSTSTEQGGGTTMAPPPVQESATTEADDKIVPTINFAQFMEGARPEAPTSTEVSQPEPVPVVVPTANAEPAPVNSSSVSDSLTLVNEEVSMNNNQIPTMPDLLAPMGSVPIQPTQPEVKVEPPITIQGNEQSPLTPDISINQPEQPVTPVVEQKEETIPVEETPVFVTASTPTSEIGMPSTPIIDNPEVSKLLSSIPQTEETIVPNVEATAVPTTSVPTTPVTVSTPAVTPAVTSVPQVQAAPAQPAAQAAPVVSTPQPDPVQATPINPAIDSIENKPIIVTDYNKQYDPIIPDDPDKYVPKVELKQVIALIRDLSRTIEEYGFNIDTDEYDLDGMYQVVFKIEKN